MKVVVEEAWDAISAKPTGIKNFTIHVKNLLKNIPYETIVFNKDFLTRIKPAILMKLVYFIWLNTVFLYKLCKLKEDVIVIGVKYFVPFFKIPNIKYYPVVHDLLAVKYKKKFKFGSFIVRLMTYNAIRTGDKIITVSETAKKEITEFFNYPENKIEVLYNTYSVSGKSKLDSQFVLNKYNLKAKGYILSVSSLVDNKNIDVLINAFNNISERHQEIMLVIVGNGKNRKKYEQMACDNVVFTGYVANEELKILYENAKMYVFVSTNEGFGIPIADAQLKGVPVLCSDIPVFREVASDNGAFFVNVSVEDVANGIEQILGNEYLQEKLIKTGKDNVKRYESEILCKQLIGILEGVD